MKISKRAKFRLVSISAPLLFVVAFTVVIVTYSHFHTPPEIDMTASGFARQMIEIPDGSTIHFVNRSPATTQILCVGTNKRCDNSIFLSRIAVPPPRDLLSPGVRLVPDQARDILFDTEGTFHVTSAVTPDMNLIVTVDATD